ncbi:MAG: hypothetical protein AAGA80_18100 [Cyanobacteria bacterium P01_F01_bin.143]
MFREATQGAKELRKLSNLSHFLPFLLNPNLDKLESQRINQRLNESTERPTATMKPPTAVISIPINIQICAFCDTLISLISSNLCDHPKASTARSRRRLIK